MKRWICLLLGLLLLSGCAAAGVETVDLMPTASPETSALAIYIYDGETITRQFLFETEQVRTKALRDFRAAKAVPVEVDVTTLQPPYYGLEVGSTEIGSQHGLWADGFFIMDDGTSYEMDYDFETLLADYPWTDSDTFRSLTIMPCADHMAKTEAGWNRNFLTPAAEPEWPDQIDVTLMEQTEKTLTLQLANHSGSEWGYGYAFHVDVLLEDRWYTIPAEEEMAFIEILLMLPDQVSQKETYDLTPYGHLPAGDYRLVTEGGPWVEFEIE